MIRLTTFCGKSDTSFCVIVLLMAAPFFASSETTIQAQSVPTQADSARRLSSATSNFQSPSATQPRPANPQEPAQSNEAKSLDPQVLNGGPLHEAFAEAHQSDPQPNPTIQLAPPEPINEVPPEFKPDGENVQWIAGYWAWDDAESEFLWISGVWRNVPPEQRWVPGYWHEMESGYCWVAGYWTGATQTELTYVPEPPANIDSGPSVIAPGEDYFYCPGNWQYQNKSFVWLAGHWQPRTERWVWIPARHIWTPQGCVYRYGYWDHKFDKRGIAYAPVRFPEPRYEYRNYEYRPAQTLNTGVNFFVNLFVKPNCSQYFYGDRYGAGHHVDHYRPWVNRNSHAGRYDPLLAHYASTRSRHDGTQVLRWVNQKRNERLRQSRDRRGESPEQKTAERQKRDLQKQNELRHREQIAINAERRGRQGESRRDGNVEDKKTDRAGSHAANRIRNQVQRDRNERTRVRTENQLAEERRVRTNQPLSQFNREQLARDQENVRRQRQADVHDKLVDMRRRPTDGRRTYSRCHEPQPYYERWA